MLRYTHALTPAALNWLHMADACIIRQSVGLCVILIASACMIANGKCAGDCIYQRIRGV